MKNEAFRKELFIFCLIGSLLILLLLSGCSTTKPMKNCAEAPERRQYLCDSLWFWE